MPSGHLAALWYHDGSLARVLYEEGEGLKYKTPTNLLSGVMFGCQREDWWKAFGDFQEPLVIHICARTTLFLSRGLGKGSSIFEQSGTLPSRRRGCAQILTHFLKYAAYHVLGVQLVVVLGDSEAEFPVYTLSRETVAISLTRKAEERSRLPLNLDMVVVRFL